MTTSLTSQNLDDKMGWGPRTDSVAVERDVIDALPHWQWCDLDSHGYLVVDVSAERVRADWWFVGNVLERHDSETHGAAWMVERGRSRVVPAASEG